MKKTKLIIVEDHQSMIDGIGLLLKYEDNIEVLGFFSNGNLVLDFIKKDEVKNYPDVILTDVKMPEMNGVELTKRIKEKYSDIKVIAFSMLAKEPVVLQMLHAGVSGYLLKNSSLDLILKAIMEIREGKTFYDVAIQEIVEGYRTNPKLDHFDNKKLLTKSELEILKLIGEGKISSEIATIRFTAVSTIEKHRKNMIRKLNLTGKNDLLRYAVEQKYDDLS